MVSSRLYHIPGVLFAIFLAALLSGCSRSRESSRTALVMDTVCTVRAYGKQPSDLQDRLFTRLVQIESVFSTTIPDSDISRINAAAGIVPVEVSSETLRVLGIALEISRLSGGAFDPTIGPLVALWGIGTDSQHVPAPEEISAVLPLVDYQLVQIDEHENTVFLPQRGMQLDAGGIAKGYAADELAGMIRAAGVYSAVIDLGGNIYVVGWKQDKIPWNVGFKDPLDTSQIFAGVAVSDRTVVTSGVYERFFVAEGIRYHHILDPVTGYPVRNGLLSCSIVASSSVLADALATAVFVLGTNKGLALLSSPVLSTLAYTERGDGEKTESTVTIEGFTVSESRKIVATPLLSSQLILYGSQYSRVQ